jgi:hypothetical protein
MRAVRYGSYKCDRLTSGVTDAGMMQLLCLQLRCMRGPWRMLLQPFKQPTSAEKENKGSSLVTL